MITEETLFILGAGASVPYGYPTAQGLREFITKEFLQKYANYLQEDRKLSNDQSMNEANKFAFLIQSFKQSSTKSFDLFLSRNKKSYYEDGKFILAWCILYFEMMSNFNEDIEKPETDWYTWLFNEMTSELAKSSDLEKFNQNRIKVITFNYDRSFEEFIQQSLFFSFAGDRKDVTKITDWIDVIHVYGKIYELQWENPLHGQKYQTNHILDLTIEAKDNIQIVYDERTTEIDAIKSIISNSNRIFFLGFGYAEENIEALGLINILTKSHKLYGTALNYTDRERVKVKSLLMKMNPALQDHHIKIENFDCVGLLREYL